MNHEEIARRRKTLRYRVTVLGYEYGRRAKHVLYYKWPELVGASIGLTLCVLTERCG